MEAVVDQRESILRAAESLLRDTDTEVVDVETAGSSRGLIVRVYVDRAEGVSVEDCVRVSRALGDQLDADDVIPGRYVLEVSSPGIDRPLRRPGDFDRFAGEEAQVTTYEKIDGKHRHRGRLAGFDAGENAVLLEEEGGVRVSIPLSGIRKANLKRDPWAPDERQPASPTAKKRQ
jgi:ribosome maturation factor RimP